MPSKSFEVKISKVDEENHIVEGVVYRPSKVFKEDGTPEDHIDTQGDWATVEDVKKACHNFSKKLALTQSVAKAGVDKGHNEKGGYGFVVENYIAKTDIPDIDAKQDDWCAAIEVTDTSTWSQIQKKEITGFSIGGTAIYINPAEGGEGDGAND